MKNLIFTGVVASAVFIFLMVQYPHSLLSPGEVSQGHQDIKQQCFSCHQAFGGIENKKCIACHALTDIGKDSIRGGTGSIAMGEKVLFHKNLDKYACTTCHTDHAGLNPGSALKGFEHEMLPETIVNDCIACHQKPQDKLHHQLTDACAKCHTTKAWLPELAFNHDMVQPADRKNCVGCHETPTDTFHSTVKGECTKCHTTDKWVPSTFDHSAYFVLDGDHNAKCATCHVTNNYSTYTCYGCHEHTASNILQEHREEGIVNLTNCVSCHKSAKKNEGGEGSREKGREGGDDD
ncbi:MAG: cytochrome c3 family protein [Saprospiraceae bacterium]|uniref:Cytochrome c3 family protein n=1 Tax=Candidatus Opimibacter skivensis TaxID=2982028 RepID=A0A9D7SQ42_9BACT|nr:cytochrome c3 family protein [Candidatus Opimibacter skivensis]